MIEMVTEGFDYQDMMDNDFNVIANKFFDNRNIIRKAILSRPQSWEVALRFTTDEVIAHPEKYLYENDAYALMAHFLLDTSLSMDGEAFKTTAKVISRNVAEVRQKKNEQKLESE